jgi:ABC-type nitrate/sulfonate/bicarbonate transport system substrate-binding protein
MPLLNLVLMVFGFTFYTTHGGVTMDKNYEGMMLDCGLKVKNGKIVEQPPVDQAALKKTIEAMQVPQPWTVARKKALAEALAKKRR